MVMSVGDALQLFFSQTCHGHNCIAVDATLQHRAGYFQGRFSLTFLDPALFAKLDAFLHPVLFQSLCKVIKITSCCGDRRASSCRNASDLAVSPVCSIQFIK